VTLAHLESKQQTPLAVFRCCGLADTLYNSVSMPAKKGSAAKVAKQPTAADDLRLVKHFMFLLQSAMGNGRPKEEVLGDFSKELHNELCTYHPLPTLLITLGLVDCSMRQESLSNMLKNFMPLSKPLGSSSMQWRLFEHPEEEPDGTILLAGVTYELANIPKVQKTLEKYKRNLVYQQHKKWNAEYKAAKAATWQEYEESHLPMHLLKHASVEERVAPHTISMNKIDYVRTTDVSQRFIAVRLECGHLYVCSDAPCTLEWREHAEQFHKRDSMLCILGQMTVGTQQDLHQDPIRLVMDNLLSQSVKKQ